MACCIPQASTAAEFGISQLMQALSRIEERESSFTEKKFIALLAEPLVSSGTLRYQRPARLERITLAPRPERFIYEGGKIVIESNGRQRQFQADAQPALAGLVESIRATLAGDEAGLRRHFGLKISGSPAGWTIEMSPLAPDLLSRLRQIRISGIGSELRKIEVYETSGDSTEMMIDAIRR